ncbi:UDP-glycosyltransferase 74G1-like [Cynara cardunculus var. scolymus]|uniref:Glycosyltransferase n=1 Tax=Cynara cardunculus var. scolymus TaxID=59895 RepID=A0A103Y371_CYNCS|nr:UDP-glycosyltransferase 74G1-like [Cynara cardunculus var. scolymus]KVI01672.1 UDP-glucuronosyl/UDP-glucosyltransferase [Cynara cardunculus var. scolymus]
MAAEDKTKKPPHVLLFPFPSQGHINPLIQFAKRLISKGVKTTLITTIFVSNSILSNHSHNTIPIVSISDGFDVGGFATAGSSEIYLESFREVGSKSLADVIRKFHSEGTTIDAIVYDSFINWTLDVAMEFGIDGGAFLTQACAVNNIYYQVYKGILSIPADSTVSVPGLPELEYWETPSFVQNPGPYPAWSHIVFNQFSNFDQTRWVFSNTFYKLEEEVIEWMKTLWPLRVIGPTIPSMYLDRRLQYDNDYGVNLIKPNHNECMEWLNDKPKGSVVYVAFGSYGELVPEQMEEVAWGLKDSDLNFLWVVRASEEEKLPKGFVDRETKKGLVVAWCRQLKVLSHEAVGCFVTHCGFNSSLEAVSLGVPVIAMPQWTDQITNAKCLEDIWGVGIRVKRDEKGIVKRVNLVSGIKAIMDGEQGVVARRNAKKWRDLTKEAVAEGGSSDKDIDVFVSDLNRSRLRS